MSYTREYHPCGISLLKDGSPFRLSTPNHFETLEDAKDVLAFWVTNPNYIVLATWVDTVCISEWEIRGRKKRSEQINKVSWREYPSNYRRFSMTTIRALKVEVADILYNNGVINQQQREHFNFVTNFEHPKIEFLVGVKAMCALQDIPEETWIKVKDLLSDERFDIIFNPEVKTEKQ